MPPNAPSCCGGVCVVFDLLFIRCALSIPIMFVTLGASTSVTNTFHTQRHIQYRSHSHRVHSHYRNRGGAEAASGTITWGGIVVGACGVTRWRLYLVGAEEEEDEDAAVLTHRHHLFVVEAEINRDHGL